MFIGVTGYNHESSAALVNKNGVLLDFYKEESLSRIKGDKSFPRRSIKKLLESNILLIDLFGKDLSPLIRLRDSSLQKSISTPFLSTNAAEDS